MALSISVLLFVVTAPDRGCGSNDENHLHGQSVRSDEIVCACDNSCMVQTTISPCDVLIIGAGVGGYAVCFGIG